MSEHNEKNNALSESKSTEQNQQNSQDNNSINGNEHPISAGLKFFSYLIDSPERAQRALKFGRTVLIFLWLLVLTILVIKPPNKFTVGQFLELDFGTITLKEDGNSTKTMVLNPNGGSTDDDNAWVDTQIKVKKGDKVKINASGKINVAVGRLIKSAKDDIRLMTRWNDPNGLPSTYDDPNYPEVKNFKLMKEQLFGKLIAGVKESNSIIKPYAIGKENVFEVENDGNLFLTVNDIWLSPDNKEAYLPPISNTDYYRNEVLESINSENNSIAENTYSQWSEEKRKQEIQKQYDLRNEKWQQIKRERNFSLWYDDNIGAFVVTISIESAKK
jgi:hypothetical protein